jgi:hypothetical protein
MMVRREGELRMRVIPGRPKSGRSSVLSSFLRSARATAQLSALHPRTWRMPRGLLEATYPQRSVVKVSCTRNTASKRDGRHRYFL